MSIMDKLKKNSKIKTSETLTESKLFSEKDMTPTDVPMVNVALSGSVDGGLAPGLTVLAGPSKHFKTSFALLMAAAYLKARPNAVVLFYDSEFGSPKSPKCLALVGQVRTHAGTLSSSGRFSL